MPELSAPVVLIIFNRPHLVRQVWETIRAARPRRLFVVADGPRSDRPEDAALCAACRAIVAQVDWPCEVEHNYAERNLNCGLRVATGLDWVFSQVEEAIVLEDDILPDPSFFGFCQALLERYRSDEQCMGIGGYNVLGEWRRADGSYFFHRHPMTWGWATWARAWRSFDYHLERYRTWNVHERLMAHLGDPEMAAYYWDLFQHLKPALTDAWDTQWVLICYVLGGRWISPTINLVTNVGFDGDATHTGMAHDLRGLIRRGGALWPLNAPAQPGQDAVVDEGFDRWAFLLQTLNSYREMRRLSVWLRALDTNPDLAMPGVFRGGRSTLAPLRNPAELLTVLDYVTPFLADNPRLHRMKADLAALAARP
jgi:hypothetical protein